MSCSQFLESSLSDSLQTTIPNVPGVLLNSLCVLCFAQILWFKRECTVNNKASMFKFLFVKAVCDLLFYTNDLLYLMFIYCKFSYNTSCRLRAMVSFLYWFIYLYGYLESIVLMVSALMEVAATLGKQTFLSASFYDMSNNKLLLKS
jgi:hypothetical protein